MSKLSKRLISIVTTVVVATGLLFSNFSPIAASAATAVETQQNTETEAVGANQAATIQDGVILHAWCWSFNSIKENMADIAAAGYTSVQTSPAQQCLEGAGGNNPSLENSLANPTWYYHYQPTYFKLGNYQLGTAEEFKQMCEVAHQYGVKIIVDVVANHLSDTTSKVDQELYNDRHKNGRVEDWSNRTQVTQNNMDTLVDINTAGSIAQEKIGNYLVELAKAGADGYRFDAAKSIELPTESTGAPTSQFWPTVMGKARAINPNLFMYGETLQGDEPGTNFLGYAQIMNVTGSTYGWYVRSAVGLETWECKDKTGQINILGGNGNNGKVTPKISQGLVAKYMNGAGDNVTLPNSKLVAFVETHDTYANLGPSRTLSQNQIQLAWAMVAARQGAVPLFFNRPSSQSFGDDPMHPQGEAFKTVGQKGSDDFKQPNVVEINKFHNLMANEDESVSAENNNNIMKIQRGKKGLVLVNVGGSTDINIGTSLPDGQYKNRAAYGGTFTVSGGRVTGNMSSSSIAILYKIDNPDDQTPEITISQEGGEFKNTLQLTLGYTNATSGTYSIDGAAPTAFTNGKSVPIGENTPVGGTVKLTVNAIGAKSTTTKTYTFTKIDSVVPKTDADAYLKLPAGWGAPKIYVYDDTVSPAKNNGWPGVAMTDLGDGLFSYKLPTGWTKAKVMFTSGSNQIPGPSLPGFDLVAGQPMIYEDGKWGPYTGGELQVSDLSADNQSITAGTEVTLTGKASGGKGTKTFKFTVNDGTSTEVLSNSTATSVKWTPVKAGNYTIDLVVTDSTGATSNKSVKLVVGKGDGKLPVIEGVSSTKSGNNITYTVNASGGDTVGNGLLFYKFYVKNADGTYKIGQNYSLSKTFTTTATAIKVEVQNSLNDTVSKEATYSEDPVDELQITSFTTDKVSPSNTGAPITLKALAKGTGTIYYKFVITNGSNQYVLQDFSDKNTVVWVPKNEGSVVLTVYAIDDSGKIVNNQINYTIRNTITKLEMNSLTPNQASPQNVGTQITLNTSSTGGTGTLQTKFAVHDGANWKLIKDYSTASSTVWTPTAAGVYQINATVKDAAGNTSTKTLIYVINKIETKVVMNSLTASIQSPQNVGTQITLNTSSTGGTGTLQTKFAVYDGSKWKLINNYSTASSTVWTPTAAGIYQINATVKDAAGNTSTKSLTYVVKQDSEIKINSVKGIAATTQSVGGIIVLKADVTGGTGTLVGKFEVFDGKTFNTLQDYSTKGYAIWKPTSAGSHIIIFSVKDQTGLVVSKALTYVVQ
jgi:alpha-amylase